MSDMKEVPGAAPADDPQGGTIPFDRGDGAVKGPFFLYQSIVLLVVNRAKAGNFRICEKDTQGRPIVRKIGWSGSAIQEELLRQAGDKATFRSLFLNFFFEYADSPEQAYERACRDFHEFRGTLADTRHPRWSGETPRTCPVEGCEHHGK